MARILVADDNEDILDLVVACLERDGHEIVPAVDGTQAWGLARTASVDLAVLDVMMQGLSGIEVLGEIRRDPALFDLPVILLTAKAGEKSTRLGLEAGANVYVTKPFSPRDLAARVTDLLV